MHQVLSCFYFFLGGGGGCKELTGGGGGTHSMHIGYLVCRMAGQLRGWTWCRKHDY